MRKELREKYKNEINELKFYKKTMSTKNLRVKVYEVSYRYGVSVDRVYSDLYR